MHMAEWWKTQKTKSLWSGKKSTEKKLSAVILPVNVCFFVDQYLSVYIWKYKESKMISEKQEL